MNSLITEILFICIGISLSIGLIYLLAGFKEKDEKIYHYFGVIGIFNAFYLFFQFQEFPEGLQILHTNITIFFIAGYYAVFPFFTEEFTGFKNSKLKWSAFGVVCLAYIILLFSSIFTLNYIFQVTAHIGLIIINIHGIIGGIHLFRKGNKKTGLFFLLFIFISSFLSIEEILFVHFNMGFNFRDITPIMPLDFFPILFVLLMAIKLTNDLIIRYQLERVLLSTNKQWSHFQENIESIIVQLDNSGNVVYINPYFYKLTGFSQEETIGTNWFEKFVPKAIKQETFGVFEDISNPKYAHYKNPILDKTGNELFIVWSNVIVEDEYGIKQGTLSVGRDITNEQQSLKEINKLKNQLEKENLQLKDEINLKHIHHEVIGKSDALQYTIKKALKVARTGTSILLEGETGVGKEIFANFIHKKSSRSNQPFVKINCATLPKDLIESELFGHEKGAFTGAVQFRKGLFERANGGSIFLDEIGELPLDLQAKLLRILQSGDLERLGGQKTVKVDVRIISATNRVLLDEVKTGNFREDLFYRLNVYPITIPPLRDRLEDIPLLVQHLVEKLSKKVGKRFREISKGDLLKLRKYSWPGNIRELENMVERAMILSSGEILKFENIQVEESPNNNPTNLNNGSLEDWEKAFIKDVLDNCDWQINGKEGAAEKLKLPPSTLRSKMKKLQLQRPNSQ